MDNLKSLPTKKKIPGPPAMTSVVLRTDEDLMAKLKEVASRQGVRVSEVINHVLREHIGEY